MQAGQYPVVHSVNTVDSYPLIITQEQTAPCQHKQQVACCSNHYHNQPVKKVTGSGFPLSLSTMIQATMLMMASIIAVCGYQACQAGKFTCTWKSFPDISHVMGGPPLNKLYSIMLTIYSCTKQAEARAYHDRLSGFVSPLVNGILLLAALVSFVFGPLIGFFDCYYDMPNHMFATTCFTGGEIVYNYGIIYLLATNRNQFPVQANSAINWCILALIITTIDGYCMFYLGPSGTGISIH